MLRRHELLAAAGAGGAQSNEAAHYEFMSGALLVDSSGKGNTLTASPVSPVACTALKPGLGCADFDTGDDQGFYIPDSSLSDDFPLKNGSGNNKISVCLWLKGEVNHWWQRIIGKWDAAGLKRSFQLIFNGNTRIPYMSVGYNGGVSSETICTYGSALSDGSLFHVGATYNGDTKEGRIRVWSDSAGALLDSDATGTGSQVINIGDASFYIGTQQGGISSFDGKMADVRIFPQELTPDEIDLVRQGLL